MTALELAREERLDLADFLAGLTPEQWASPTLCEGWCVRDVAAHQQHLAATGRHIVQASASNLKKVQLELGGKGPNIVFATPS